MTAGHVVAVPDNDVYVNMNVGVEEEKLPASVVEGGDAPALNVREQSVKGSLSEPGIFDDSDWKDVTPATDD